MGWFSEPAVFTRHDAELIAEAAVRTFAEALLAQADRRLERGDQTLRIEILRDVFRDALEDWKAGTARKLCNGEGGTGLGSGDLGAADEGERTGLRPLSDRA